METEEISRQTLGRRWNLRILNDALDKQDLCLESNAESLLRMTSNPDVHHDVVTRTAAIYHLHDGKVHLAFDDHPTDNALLELDTLLGLGMGKVRGDTRVIQRQLERAYDTNRVINTHAIRAVRSWTGRDGYKTTGFHYNRILFKTRKDPDPRLTAFFGDEDSAAAFLQFASRYTSEVPMHVKGTDRLQEFGDLSRGRVLVCMSGLYHNPQGVVHLSAYDHCTDMNAGYGKTQH